MFCPLCGAGLRLVPPKSEEPSEIDWDLPGPELDKAIKREQGKVKSENYKWDAYCEKECLGKNIGLFYHSPWNIYSRPGDSWSLSWVK